MTASFRSTTLILFVGFLLLETAGLSSAQVVALNPIDGINPPANDRDQLYAEVAQEVSGLEQYGNLLRKVVKLVRPTVVHLESIKAGQTATISNRRPPVEEAGSGVVIDLRGENYVLTNRHVITNASLNNIHIRLSDGRYLKPLKVWEDPDTDVGVIHVKDANLVPARIGDSDRVDIGDFVLAVGSPFGLSHSVSYGIISAKGRRDLELGNEEVRLQDFLQTDAAINPGNSGGPLLNLRGEVIGINTAIASNSGGNEGVSFAIPINLVMFAAQQLIDRGEVNHAYLGVQLDNDFNLERARTLGLNRVRGALIKGITPRSPAFFANLQVNDLIAEFNGIPVEDDDHLVNLVSLTPINETVSIRVLRNSKPVTLRVKMGNRRHFEPQDTPVQH